MSRRVVHLHIGAPKTGTTYLQDRLMLNQAQLAEHGVTIPTKNRFVDADLFHFRAALDLLDQDWGGAPGHAVGAWDTMVKRVRRAKGTVVISHEILAPTKPDTIARVMNDFADSEVHVVYSARDLGRQLPAAWQESIKQGRKWTFDRFLTKVERGQTWFRAAMDLPTVLDNWGAKLPPERVHVVTVPHDRGPTGNELWLRFCRAFGIDPAWAPLDSERANRSLGIAETQLIRRLNRRLELPVWRDATYDGLIRELLAQQVLVSRDAIPVRLPPERFDFAEEQAERWVEWIKGAGVDVVGDVEDLRPVRPAPDATWRDPDKVSPKLQLGAALDALAMMTREAAERTPSGDLPQKLRQQARRLRER
ncbi:hypothetical protein [Nocardioides piscis]|uniref:Sulfotransferase family protein n=1 Tax=Nocardioides piscis TaxID=2714938 RepID=A0A6G7YDY0_9ACTN|nr:hypothetical protein [Nocardioides piscis]QIK74851.1 hypothetical protein G7071_04810 [Nocardioides piscis]